jgi:hypothetical protein
MASFLLYIIGTILNFELSLSNYSLIAITTKKHAGIRGDFVDTGKIKIPSNQP